MHGKSAFHGLLITRFQTSIFDFRWRVITVQAGKSLLDLGAAAMTMHITKTSDIHEDVELELLTGVVATQRFIVLAAVTQS